MSPKEPFGTNRSTPLHFACSKRATAICELLIEYGADVNAKDLNDSTPLHSAGIGNAQTSLLITNKADGVGFQL